MDSRPEKHQCLYQVFANKALRKNMHSYRPLMITIALLFAICLFSGCISPLGPANQTPQIPSPNASPKTDVGVIPIEMVPSAKFISFDEAKDSLKDSDSLSSNQFQKERRILFIQGGNLDESGNAERWVFGVTKGDIKELRVYDRTGWTIIPWNNAISAEEIDLNGVVSPTTIFDQNKKQILESSPSTIPAQRDIELKNGTYTFTITSGSMSEILMFNATTGAAIE
ncbi:MAG: hypothetical protein ABSG49_01785 [Methanoregula sp.]|jgi:hypothetical protein|uniref:hypothetical protein n=1 Tax=Methanoregula sp. TaxID=2052170 RepID=UPI003C1FACF0